MPTTSSTATHDVVLIGGGIMSATLGVLLHQHRTSAILRWSMQLSDFFSMQPVMKAVLNMQK